MKNQFKIGSSKENEIVVQDKECPMLLAEINYDKGNWILNNLVKQKAIFVNNEKVEGLKKLNKNDKIKIGREIFYWSNYLYEGESQELHLKEIFTYNGRISRSNFRALSLLAIGLTICVFFSPGLVATIRRGKRGNTEDFEKFIEITTPSIHIIGFSLIGITMLLLAIKRMRDTGNPIWKLWLPIYNFKILYFDESKNISQN